jgi:hypothetical protein
MQEFYPELKEILTMAAGTSPGGEADQYSTTLVCLLPESLLKRDPRDAVAGLLDDPPPPPDAEGIRKLISRRISRPPNGPSFTSSLTGPPNE